MSPIKDKETEKQEVKKPPASEVKTVKQKSPTKQIDFSDKKGIIIILCVYVFLCVFLCCALPREFLAELGR